MIRTGKSLRTSREGRPAAARNAQESRRGHDDSRIKNNTINAAPRRDTRRDPCPPRRKLPPRKASRRLWFCDGFSAFLSTSVFDYQVVCPMKRNASPLFSPRRDHHRVKISWPTHQPTLLAVTNNVYASTLPIAKLITYTQDAHQLATKGPKPGPHATHTILFLAKRACTVNSALQF